MDEQGFSNKQRFWLQHVEACGRSGVSMKAYAEQHALDLQQFYFWKGRLKKLGAIDGKPGCHAAEPVRLVSPVKLSAKMEGKTCIQLANGVSIEAPGDFDVDALAALLAAAKRL